MTVKDDRCHPTYPPLHLKHVHNTANTKIQCSVHSSSLRLLSPALSEPVVPLAPVLAVSKVDLGEGLTTTTVVEVEVEVEVEAEAEAEAQAPIAENKGQDRQMSSRRRKIQRVWQHDSEHPNGDHVGSSGEIHSLIEGCSFDTELSSVGIDEMLELDPRPTFVLQTKDDYDTLVPVFMNSSLRSDLQLLNGVSFNSKADASLGVDILHSEFKSWIKQIPDHQTSLSFSYLDVSWTGYTVRDWTIVGGHRDESVANRKQISMYNGRTSSRRQHSSTSQRRPRRALTTSSDDANGLLQCQPNTSITSFVSPGTPDWTVENPQGILSPQITLARTIDWASTPLGPMSTWSPELRQVACLLMANPHPAALFWGEELTVLYNQAYAEKEAGTKHPYLMGTGASGPFAEVWHMLEPIFSECRRTGKGFSVNDQLLPLERHGFIEETYYTWSLTPLYGGTQQLLGFYNAPFETTGQIRSERALKTLLRLGQEMALATSIPDFWPKILSGLSDNRLDFPFAILYSVADEEDVSSQCSESCQGLPSCILEGESQCSDVYLNLKSCDLEGTLGVPEDHPAAPKRMNLRKSAEGLVTAFRDAMHTGEPKLLRLEDGTLPEALLDNIEWRGFGKPCREVVVCPIRPIHSTGDTVLGFLVLGVNPRREFDEDYQSFIQLLDRQIATSLASITLLESEIRRSRNAAEAAALERTRLSEELAVQRSRLQRIAEVSLVGMFSIDPNGLLLEANSRWFEMTGHSKTIIYAMSWMETVHENSLLVVRDLWEKLTVDQVPWSGEVQLKKPWYDAVTDDVVDRWIIAACQPEFSSDGQLKSVMGSITDISRKKWAEALQLRRLQEAEEIRRAQNNFIDITSHEMRNPLSAILQCADGISTSLTDMMQAQLLLDSESQLTLKECISSAETIQLCAQHQKSIVDDILTISKLDSNLLLITPVPTQPIEIARQALQMFMVECRKIHDIKLEFHIEKSFRDLKVDTVMLDSSRLLQVLINLLTNAIKFTKSSELRKIDVFVGAYLDPPHPRGSEFEYFPSPSKKARSDVTATTEWGNGDVVYLRFEVKDSGCGLNAEEKKKLFNRFSQASPRTHVQYGGSGLGLFISRQLTELQGGEIGVASEAGEGSTFAFYVKARRAASGQDIETLRRRISWEAQSNARPTTDTQDNIKNQDVFVSKLTELAEKEESTLPESSPSDWHILIVEDNLVNQRILAQQIRKLGAVVHVANHGGEALEMIQESKHYKGREENGKELSVILMDLEMPIMDGLTCVRKIREMEIEGLIHGHLPIIAVTANARGEQIVLAKDSGMDDVMPKPFRIVHIRAKIEALLKRMR